MKVWNTCHYADSLLGGPITDLQLDCKSVKAFSSDAGVAVNTVKAWISVLETSYLAYGGETASTRRGVEVTPWRQIQAAGW